MTQNQSKTRPLPIWQRIPLYLQILIALFLGVGLGVVLGAVPYLTASTGVL